MTNITMSGTVKIFNVDTLVKRINRRTGAVVSCSLYRAGDRTRIYNNAYRYEYQALTEDAAKLTGLTIGTETLTPTFAKDKTQYTVTTTGTLAVTATPKYSDATVAITYNSNTVTNGGNITVADGTNNLVVTVTKDGIANEYTVAITKTAVGG